MSNKTTFQEKNTRLNNNNTDLNSILETINNLPNAGGGSVSKFGELCLDYTFETDITGTNDIRFDNSKAYTELFIVVDESGISGTTYSNAVRMGVMNENCTKGTFPNTANAWRSNRKYKTMHIKAFTETMALYLVTSEVQLWAYIATEQGHGQVQFDSAYNGYGGLKFYGSFYAGTNIKVYGKN